MIGNWSIDQLMTPAEVGAAFRVDPKTVTRWAKSGRVASIRTLGGHRRFSVEQVQYLMAGGSPACDGLDRSDLTGHTITVEPLTRALCLRAGLPASAAGQRAAVERSGGRFVKVWETSAELTASTIEAVAESIARSHGATYGGTQ
ncbi:MAG: helix-turn-helix domain-containing protein [Microbispora sp.]|nr:helix-turn-helix domain-containing protein [Microbispora sp.]